MRKTLLFLMLLSVKLTFGQVSDDFSDGNLDQNPQWLGDLSNFQINSVKQLQTVLSASSQTVKMSTRNLLATNVKWEFNVHLQFDPSSTNRVKIYLVSDQSDTNLPLNGYFIQIGESGSSDSYDLYRQNGTTITKIIDGLPKMRMDVNKLSASILVTRDADGKWELLTSTAVVPQYQSEGSVTDATFLFTDWFGISCAYTATRSNGFIFDDFKISQLSPDVNPPQLLSAAVVDEFHVEATFSERLLTSSALDPQFFAVTGIGNPVAIQATKLPNVYRLTFPKPFESGDYALNVGGLADLYGNVMNSGSVSFFYFKPYELEKGDVLISEVLANPKTGGVDFVEIYNATDQILDIHGLRIGNVDADGNEGNFKTLGNAAIYMKPKTYWVLTSNSAILKQGYSVRYPEQIIEMPMPAYNNDRGSVVLKTSAVTLERFNYDKGMHLALLQIHDGVSLERVSFVKPVNERGNFRSAAMTVGFATPTERNSQEQDLMLEKNSVSLAARVFSPDADGFEDILEINYRFKEPNQLATVTVYSDKGVLVRRLQRNTSIATVGSFGWDGLDDKGRLSGVGLYIIKFDAFALNGDTESFKQACVLAAKLK